MSNPLRHEPLPGDSIQDTFRTIVRLANKHGSRVVAAFNGSEIEARPGDIPEFLITAWFKDLEDEREEWRRSPEGIEATRRQEEARERARAAEAEGILPFTLRDEPGWRKAVEVNTDPYGSCVVRYAARWANRMEARLGSGERLVDIAEEESSAADLEGITGFMYGCAVSLLADVWKHGEELRQWHKQSGAAQ